MKRHRIAFGIALGIASASCANEQDPMTFDKAISEETPAPFQTDAWREGTKLGAAYACGQSIVFVPIPDSVREHYVNGLVDGQKAAKQHPEICDTIPDMSTTTTVGQINGASPTSL